MALAFSFVEVSMDSPNHKPWAREDEEKLMTLIQLGIQSGDVEEAADCYLRDTYGKVQGCAIGHALVGKYGGAKIAVENYKVARLQRDFQEYGGTNIGMFSRMLGVNADLLQKVSNKHHRGQPISSIMADMKEGVFV